MSVLNFLFWAWGCEHRWCCLRWSPCWAGVVLGGVQLFNKFVKLNWLAEREHFRKSTSSNQTELSHTKLNSSTPNQTHPYQTELNCTKPNSSIPNQTKPDNSLPNLTNPNCLGMHNRERSSASQKCKDFMPRTHFIIAGKFGLLLLLLVAHSAS